MKNCIENKNELLEDIGNIVLSTMNQNIEPGMKLTYSNKSNFSIPDGYYATYSLSLDLLCTFHSAICYEHIASPEIGKFRTVKVWIGDTNSTEESAKFIPPNPEDVQNLIKELLKDWQNNYQELKESTDKKSIISAITLFHHKFVSIHPFLDGNGRLSRYLLMLQASELLDIKHWITLEDKKIYFEALTKADNGIYDPLEKVITQALFGIEEITC